MVSNIDTAKRALVALLKSLAGIYSLVVGLTRESADAEVRAAYKQVARKAHPDKGGAPEHQKALNAARDTWEDALRAGKGRGGDHMPKASAAKSATAPVNVSGKPITLVLPTLVLHKRDSIIGPIIPPIIYPTIIWWVVRPWWAGQGANTKWRPFSLGPNKPSIMVLQF